MHLHRDAGHGEPSLTQHINNHAIGIEINLPIMAGVGVRADSQTRPTLSELKDLNIGNNITSLVGDVLKTSLQHTDRLSNIGTVGELCNKLNATVRRR